MTPEQNIDTLLSIAISDQTVLSTIISALVGGHKDPNGSTASLRQTTLNSLKGILNDPKCPDGMKKLINARIDAIFDGVHKF